MKEVLGDELVRGRYVEPGQLILNLLSADYTRVAAVHVLAHVIVEAVSHIQSERRSGRAEPVALEPHAAVELASACVFTRPAWLIVRGDMRPLFCQGVHTFIVEPTDHGYRKSFGPAQDLSLLGAAENGIDRLVVLLKQYVVEVAVVPPRELPAVWQEERHVGPMDTGGARMMVGVVDEILRKRDMNE